MCNYARIRIFPLIQGKKRYWKWISIVFWRHETFEHMLCNIRTYQQNMLCPIDDKQLIHVFSRASARSIFQLKPEAMYIIRAALLSKIAIVSDCQEWIRQSNNASKSSKVSCCRRLACSNALQCIWNFVMPTIPTNGWWEHCHRYKHRTHRPNYCWSAWELSRTRRPCSDFST